MAISKQTLVAWIAVIALLIGGYGFWKRYQYRQWAVLSQAWDNHVYQCHAVAPHPGAGTACGSSDHVPPPPPPPPWW